VIGGLRSDTLVCRGFSRWWRWSEARIVAVRQVSFVDMGDIVALVLGETVALARGVGWGSIGSLSVGACVLVRGAGSRSDSSVVLLCCLGVDPDAEVALDVL
jgi:hypothetical protein